MIDIETPSGSKDGSRVRPPCAPRAQDSPGDGETQDRKRIVFMVALMAGSYFALARTGLLAISHPTHVAAIWPAGGLLLSVLLLSRRRRWWWLLLSALAAGIAAELAVGRTVPEAIGFGVAACAESLVAAIILGRRLKAPFRLDAVRHVLMLLAAAIAGSCVAALLGAAVATAGFGSGYGTTWLLWSLVSTVGILATAPLVLALVDADRTIRRPSAPRVAEMIVVLAGLTAVTTGIFTRPAGSARLLLDFNYPILPFLLWAALRFGSRGAPVTTLLVWAIGTAGTVSGRGPFTSPDYGMTGHLLQLQSFLGLACFGVVLGGAMADELRDRQRSLAATNVRLGIEVDARRRLVGQLEQRGRLMDLAHDAIIVRNPADGAIDYWNRAAAEIYGYSAEQARGRVSHELLHTERRDCGEALDAELLDQGRWEGELWHVRADGQRILVSSRQALQRDERGEPVAVIELNTDITQQRRMEDAKHRLAAIVEHTDDAVIGKISDGTITEWNRGAQRMYGYTAQEAIGQSVEMLMLPDTAAEEWTTLRRVFQGEAFEQFETVRVRKDRSRVHVSLTLSPIRDGDGAVVAASAIGRDITERKQFEGQLQHLADHDHLTGLFNRRRFDEELRRELARAQRYGTGGTVLAIDIDHFKSVNDSLGHSAGDAVIGIVAEVFRSRLRETDVIARVGGDEFAAILPGVDREQAQVVAGGLLEALREEDRFVLPRTLRQITASIGVAPFADGAKLSSEDVMVEADSAMYDAKEAGRDRFAAYSSTEEGQGRTKARLSWGDRIRHALQNGRFVLHAQPILSLNGDPAPRHELLLRMVGESGELIVPSKFLYIAERVDLVQEIDRWVLREASRLLAREQRNRGDVRLAINLSAKSIGEPELLDTIAGELAAAGADASGLCIEVTETAAVVNVERAKRFAARLSELGCEFALDDFGADFASFYHLKHLPFDYLKIDGEFIQGICASCTDQLVVKSLAAIAHGLGKRTIAEFVSGAETLELLREYDIDYAQGFFVAESKPLAEVDLAHPVGLSPLAP